MFATLQRRVCVRLIWLIGILILTLQPLMTVTARATDGLSIYNWWNERVFYEVFVRSFKDSDGDGIGDLQGLIDSLDYLNDGDPSTTDDLGIGGIWLMPIMQAESYHGYDVTDYELIDRDYGTMREMRRLVEEAHQRGIAVIVDLVINHTSDAHPWFQASARRHPLFRDWYVWSDRDPGFRGPNNQPVWHQRDGSYYYAVFWHRMPDLNLTNPLVTETLYDISAYWLNDIGVDGFRLDAVKHLVEEGSEQENTASTHAWLAAFNAHLDAVAPESLTVGEVWSTSYVVDDYVNNGAVDIAFEFDFALALLQAVRQGRNDAVTSLQNRALDLYPPGQYAIFLTNHDQNRVMSELRGNIGAAKVAASLLLTNPGVPFLYYGEEIGMTGIKPDERIRTPMLWDTTPRTAGFTTARNPWQPLSSDDPLAVSVAAQTGDPDSLLSHYRALIHLRNAHPALQTGSYRLVDSASRRVYAFLRQSGDDHLLVVINPDDEAQTEYTLSVTEAGLPDGASVEILYGDGEPASAHIQNGGFEAYRPYEMLPPHSTFILSFRSE